MKRTAILAMIGIVAAIVSSCGSASGPLLPNVTGKAGEVIVVMNKADWEGNLGNEVREILASDCPWLAQKEPLYTLINVIPNQFADLFKVHRNIVYFNVDPQAASEGLMLRNDLWAHPQCVVQINAYDAESALKIVQEKSEVLVSALEQAERDRVINNTLLYEERSIAEAVRPVMGGSPHFPSGYKLKKQTDDFIWIADEKQSMMQGVLIYKYPVGNDDFTLENLISHRNSVLQENVPGMFDNTYMTTSEYIAPQLTFVKYKGREFAQIRGFWEVYNDYMGGPFVSHAFYSKDGKDIIVLDAFVYAPKFDKRLYLRQVESILYSYE